MGIETAAIAGIASTLIGAGVSAVGAVQQGNATSAAASAKASQDAYNAQVASFNAQAADASQAVKTQAIERQGTLRLGAQRAALGASGVTLNSGSGLDVQSATDEDTARQATMSQYQGSLTAYGYRTQQQNFVDQSGLDTATSSNAATAGELTAGGTLLSSAGQVSDRWSRMFGSSAPTYPDRTGMGYQIGALY